LTTIETFVIARVKSRLPKELKQKLDSVGGSKAKAGQEQVKSRSRAGQEQVKSRSRAGQEQVKSRSRAGQEQVKSRSRAGPSTGLRMTLYFLAF